jgi:hypothetical protein
MIASDKTKRTRQGRPAGTGTPAANKRQAVVNQASGEARRRAAAMLEVLSGVRTCAQAAEALAISLPRYYLLEQRAVAGLVAACEPSSRGREPSPERRIAALERELARVSREVVRHQALARAAQRTLGLAPPAARPGDKRTEKKTASGKSRRRRRPTVRALQLAKELGRLDGNLVGGNLGENSSGVGGTPDVKQSAAS